MANPLATVFTSFDLSPTELQVGQTFHHLNKFFMHNLRTEFAQRKLMLQVEPGKEQAYFLEQARLEGCISTLGILIDIEPEVPEQSTTEG